MFQIILDLLSSRFYVVRGGSMSPTIEDGHQLLVLPINPSHILSRGDLVIIHDLKCMRGFYLKRIVGLPGELIQFLDGLLYVNRENLSEPYLGNLPASLSLKNGVWSLQAGEYFVLGDRRSRSTDSRDFGPVDSSQIAGKIWLRYWPLSKFGKVSCVDRTSFGSDDPLM